MKYVIIFVFLFFCHLYPQNFNDEPLAHTFSIVARDAETGELGVAVQSHWFSVGSIVSWAEAGVGAVATQSLVNESFGQRGIDLLKEGKMPQEALDQLLAGDEGRAFRQVAIIDNKGNVAANTGDKCIADAAHITGKNFSVQANMMLNKKVVPAMAEAFEKSEGPLAERMMAVLLAAQSAGGDIRGQQSAAILVVRGESTGKVWQDRLIDLRVEDHPDAVDELARVLRVFRAYEHMNAGDLAIEHGDEEKALQEYGAAMEMFPKNVEMKFWTAVSLANLGKIDQALPLFREVFKRDENWKELTRRIVANGLLSIQEETLERILE
jgi:uncharacterized Ntn-hydrolase superfamily protein